MDTPTIKIIKLFCNGVMLVAGLVAQFRGEHAKAAMYFALVAAMGW